MMPDVDKVLVLGDMHGNLFSWERHVASVVRQHKPDLILQVGDFGYGWSEDYLPVLDDILDELNIECFWLDGNHENFDLLEKVGAFGSPVPFVTSRHTTYIPRGSAWTWRGKKCMAVGGAYSVDKPYRTPHRSWWPQEELTDTDVDSAVAVGKCDVVFAHDAFTGLRVPGIHADWKQDDFGPVCKPNRDKLLEIVDSARPDLFIHGHFHEGYSTCDNCYPALEVVGLNRESEPGSMIMLEFPSIAWSLV